MRLTHDGAQRASLRSADPGSDDTVGRPLAMAPRRRRLPRLVPLAAAVLGLGALGILPASASAATAIHVVVVAGPVESQTAK